MNKPDQALTLYNGVQIPSLGFGTWQIPNFQAAKCVTAAVKAGYRNFDTAEGYMNEKGLGEGSRRSMGELGAERGELFVSTKVWNSHLSNLHPLAASKADCSAAKVYT